MRSFLPGAFAAISIVFSASALSGGHKGGQESAQERSPWQFSLGAAVINSPEYEGAKDNETKGLPYFSVRYKNTLSLDPLEGLKYNAWQTEHFTLGAGLGFDFGRKDDAADILAGLGDVDAAVIPKVYAEAKHGDLSLSIEHNNDIGDNGHEGQTNEISLKYKVTLNPTLFITPSISILHGNEDYAQSYFGISAAQSDNSLAGLPTFKADDGIISQAVGATAFYLIDKHWSSVLFLKHSTLSSDIRKSPLVQDTSQSTAGLVVSYTF